jgi:C-terminal processing protease CtpA/Prc
MCLPAHPLPSVVSAAGDIILQIDGADVDQPQAAVQAIRQALRKDGKAVLLLVKNERGQRFVALQKARG